LPSRAEKEKIKLELEHTVTARKSPKCPDKTSRETAKCLDKDLNPRSYYSEDNALPIELTRQDAMLQK
jgi:hypothetical protein